MVVSRSTDMEKPPRSFPLASRHLVTTDDIGELTRIITNATATPHRHDVSVRGPIVGTVSGTRLNSLGLAVISYSQVVAITTDPRPGAVVAVVPLGPMYVDANGTRWTGVEPFFVSAAHPTTLRPAPGRGGLCVSFDAEPFTERLDEFGVRAATGRLELLGGSESRVLDGGLAVRGVLLEVCRMLDEEPDENVKVSHSIIESSVFSALLMGLRSQFVWGNLRVPSSRYVDEARAWIKEHLAEPRTVGDIARAVNLSPRHLHAVFIRHIGVSPARYLREQRMKHVRQLLLNSADPDLTINSAAAQAGIVHLGRFAGDYAKRYGEPPSMTLARTRNWG